MKRLAAIALLLFAGACDTTGYPPYDEPAYPGAPYPPDSAPPYPNDPYPPDGVFPPGSGYPSPPVQPPPPACEITNSGEWRAWIGSPPEAAGQPTLFVSGKVVTATGGFQIGFEPFLQIAESYPAQAFATLRVVPPSGGAVEVVTTHNLSWQWPLRQSVGRVVIRCGDRTLADLPLTNTAR